MREGILVESLNDFLKSDHFLRLLLTNHHQLGDLKQ